MKPGDAERCSKEVRSDGMGFHFHQCFSKAVVVRDGKPFCKLHDPLEVEKKTLARQAKYDAEWKHREYTHDLQAEEDRLKLLIVKCVRSAPQLECRPTTAFGRQYVEWHRKVERLLARLEKNKHKWKAV